MRVILSFFSFLHTKIGISVPVLWHLFNMKNRFYILRYLCSFYFQEPFSSQYVSGLSCRKRGSCHFILMGDNLRFQRISPDPFSLVSFPTLQLRHCSMNTGVQEVFFLLFFDVLILPLISEYVKHNFENFWWFLCIFCL
jgi:hypothetical protein